MRALVAIVLTGCWSASQPAWTSPPTIGEAAPLPECPIRIGEQGHVFVWEADLGPIASRSEHVPEQLSVFQTGNDAYLAVRERMDEQGPRGGDTLWHVSCAGKKLDAITIAGADFGNAALHPDRKRLFFSAGGVIELDLATRKQRRLTVPGTRTQCADHDGAVALRDTVTGATRDHVEFSRGGPCGLAGAYDAAPMRRHLDSGIEEKATPITGIVTSGDEVWIASGDCGSAAVHRTTDWRSWSRVKLPAVQGAITLVADAPKTIAIATGLCSGTAGGLPASITRDGGTTWSAIGDTVIEWVHGEDLAHLRAGAASGKQLRWKGSALVELAGEWTTAPTLPATLTILGRTVRPTRFGLYDAKTDERLFPR